MGAPLTSPGRLLALKLDGTNVGVALGLVVVKSSATCDDDDDDDDDFGLF